MKTIIKQIIGGATVVGALVFAWTMDGIAEVNKSHTFSAQFQRGITPTQEYKSVLEDVVSLMNANENYTVRVETHTGTRGPEQGNMELAEQRAERVYSDLRSSGIDTSRVTVVAIGEANPPIQGKHETDTLWQKRSARAEFFVEVE